MQKILGLDIGSYSIKAVEILNTFKTHKVTNFYEIVIPEIEGLDSSLVGLTAVKQLFSENDIDADRTYTAMMGLLCSMRVLQLQNVKKRMIPQVVQNELETQAPFELDEVVIDSQVLDSKENNTSVLSVLCRKDHIEAYLNGLKDLEIEPKVIDVDYLSFLNLFPYINFSDTNTSLLSQMADPNFKKGSTLLDAGKCRLIVDIGHLKTSMVVFKEGKLATARTIRMGGRYFTDYLQKSLGVTFNEAQRLKHAISQIEYKADSRAEKGKEREFAVAKQLGFAVTELTKEVIRTMHSFKAQDKLVPDSVVITGGSSVISGLPEFLADILQIPVERMELDSQRLKLEENIESEIPNMSQALAIGMRGVPGKVQSQINLRKGELALAGSYDAIIKQISGIAALAACVLVCLVASFGLRWWLYGKQITALKDQYKREVIRILGSEPKALKNMSAASNWDLKNYSAQALKIINEEIRSKDAAVASFAAKKTAVPLRILEEVSKAIPKEVKLDVTNYSLQGNLMILEGETDSFTTSEKILELVKGVSSLQNVERKSQENKPGSDGKIVKFSITASLKDGV
jgi:type IV pilus assembly protein PilM